MIPEGWKKYLLKEVLKNPIKNGYSPNTADFETGYWVLGLGALGDNGINPSEIKPVELNEKVSRSILSYGDFLIGRSNTPDKVGRSIRYKGEIENCSYPDLMMKFTVNEKLVNADFFEHKIKGHAVRAYLKSCAAGSSGTMVKINKPIVEKMPLILPSLAEQKIIAKILSTWDKAITTTEKLLANSQQQKKALMQQLLTGKKRFPGFSGRWEHKHISEIATRVQRKVDDKEHPILTISSLSGFVTQEERYSRYMAGESVKNYILLKKGEFAYNKGNSKTYQFGCIFDLESFDTGLVPHVYVCFKLKPGLSHKYFKYLFEADYLKSQLGALVNTGVRNNGLLNIKPSEFMNTKIPVPSFKEQCHIAGLMQALSESTGILQAKLSALRHEKKSLMQQLLRGKRRVKTIDLEGE